MCKSGKSKWCLLVGLALLFACASWADESEDKAVAFVEKRRLGNNSRSEQLGVIGDVRGKSAIVIDDEIDTAGSIVGAAEIVADHGARVVYAACTHALLTANAVERLRNAPIQEIIGPTTQEDLTLITCGGPFDYQNGVYLQRTVVRSHRVTS